MKFGALPSAPLVSVMVPNYNYDKFIGEALDSLIAQTYTNWEALVCDDGSTDSSREIIEQFACRDHRIHPIYQANSGVAVALNTCFHASSGEIISLLDADDVFSKDKLAIVVEAFSADTAAGLVVHQMRKSTASGRTYGRPFPRKISTGWLRNALIEHGGDVSFPLASALTLRREVALALFPIPREMQRLIDGYLMRAAALITEVRGLEAPLVAYRIHGNNLTGVTSQTAESVKRVTDDLWLVLEEVNQFIVRRYGGHPNRLLDPKTSGSYARRLLTYRLFVGRLREGSPGILELLMLVQPKSRRVGWRILISLPSWIGKRAYNTYIMHYS